LSVHDCARDGFQLKVLPEHSFDDAVESLARFGVARMCREANAPHFAIIIRTGRGNAVVLLLKLAEGALRNLDGTLICSLLSHWNLLFVFNSKLGAARAPLRCACARR